MSPTIRITRDKLETEEFEKFKKFLDGDVLPLIESVIKDSVTTIKNLIQGRTPVGDVKVDLHSGQLKKSWGMVQESQTIFSFETDVPYANVLEEGLYPWAETKRTIGGFSRQAPEGILKPLSEDPELESVIVGGIVKEIRRRLSA